MITEADWMSALVTASSPLVIYHGGRRAVAAVVGFTMKYLTFYQHFVNVTTSCGRTPSNDNSCNFTCRSPVSYTPFTRETSSSSQLIKHLTIQLDECLQYRTNRFDLIHIYEAVSTSIYQAHIKRSSSQLCVFDECPLSVSFRYRCS